MLRRHKKKGSLPTTPIQDESVNQRLNLYAVELPDYFVVSGKHPSSDPARDWSAKQLVYRIINENTAELVGIKVASKDGFNGFFSCLKAPRSSTNQASNQILRHFIMEPQCINSQSFTIYTITKKAESSSIQDELSKQKDFMQELYESEVAYAKEKEKANPRGSYTHYMRRIPLPPCTLDAYETIEDLLTSRDALFPEKRPASSSQQLVIAPSLPTLPQPNLYQGNFSFPMPPMLPPASSFTSLPTSAPFINAPVFESSITQDIELLTALIKLPEPTVKKAENIALKSAACFIKTLSSTPQRIKPYLTERQTYASTLFTQCKDCLLETKNTLIEIFDKTLSAFKEDASLANDKQAWEGMIQADILSDLLDKIDPEEDEANNYIHFMIDKMSFYIQSAQQFILIDCKHDTDKAQQQLDSWRSLPIHSELDAAMAAQPVTTQVTATSSALFFGSAVSSIMSVDYDSGSDSPPRKKAKSTNGQSVTTAMSNLDDEILAFHGSLEERKNSDTSYDEVDYDALGLSDLYMGLLDKVKLEKHCDDADANSHIQDRLIEFRNLGIKACRT